MRRELPVKLGKAIIAFALVTATAPRPAYAAEVHTYLMETLCSLTGEGCHNVFYMMPSDPAGLNSEAVDCGVHEATIKWNTQTTVTADGSVWKLLTTDCMQSENVPVGAVPIPPELLHLGSHNCQPGYWCNGKPQ
ncbi:MAG TPA: hypothetical protein VFI23_14680 [Rhizomicrobium sp.]|nr:hypothetical protein [Rhizomicrobium sp.]